MKLRTLFEKRAVSLEPESANEEKLGRFIAISDLHIGFEEKFKASGINIKSNVDFMEAEIEEIVRTTHSENLVIAGDVKSGTERIFQSEWENVPRFLSRLAKVCQVSIVPGNHDGGISNLLPESVILGDINGILISDTLVLHGHTRPLVKYSQCRRILMGHVHPVFQKRGSPLSGKPVWAFLKVRRKSIFREIVEVEEDATIEVVVIPSFNLDLAATGYAFEAAQQERRLSPIVKELRSAEEAIVTTLSGEVIGDQSILPNIL
ncbi:MAG: metallophosphoesterase [Thaumarchaeota archaeon]|nr:metallophosphoesterase [Nitrososphaerota archaeon]